MPINENSKKFKIYVRSLDMWFDVTEEFYYNYYRDIWATQNKARNHGQCMCPKSKNWLCDGDCPTCEFKAAGDQLSLDYTFENKKGEQQSLLDTLSADEPEIASIVADIETLSNLMKLLQKLDPEARRICELIMEGKSERESASILDMPRNTFVYRRDKLLESLKSKLK